MVNSSTRYSKESEEISSSSLGYSGLINKIYNKKIESYENNEYFPQIYEPSIQATYYALTILHAIDKLEEVNTSQLANYIMSFYDPNQSIFIDSYAKRWLDANYDRENIYPLSSLLEINCYAVLSLDILGALDLIDVQNMVDLVWDCYNPVGGGFIGMPFDIDLPDYLKDPTMDNTFFAVQVIDRLDNWDLYNTVKVKIAGFGSDLQSTMSDSKFFGGFYNSFGSCNALMMLEPNLLTAYYCIMTLKTLGKLSEINIANFHTYLSTIYEPTTSSFYFSGFQNHISDNELNIVGTALALELADVTDFTVHDRAKGLQFVLNNKNPWGMWDQSTDIHYHELIDTFQIVRSLKNMGVFSVMVESEKNLIISTLHYYFSLGGYSLLSEDYTSLRSINYLINSYDTFNRLSDLPVSQLYLALESCYTADYNFRGSINMYSSAPFFRSYPLEYFSIGNQELLYSIERITSQKNTYLALDALVALSKLPLFEATYGLSNIVTAILECQFLEENYTNYGGFLPKRSFTIMATPRYQNACMDFIDSYYAIRSLELLAPCLHYENMSNFTFNHNALRTYILDQKSEVGDEISFKPNGIQHKELILEYTYYAIYMLKVLGFYDLDPMKIKNFVTNNLDYTNLRNIYYSYQLSELLNLSVYFDISLIQSLITNVYDSTLYEFYESTERRTICLEGFYWVCSLEKWFTNPDYKDVNFFRDFSGEFLHTMILGGLMIIIPGVIWIATSKNIHFTNVSQRIRKKLKY
ncbi:MAG: hypothetical protein ACFFBH_10730 [Promethearchaeota archaeon]